MKENRCIFIIISLFFHTHTKKKEGKKEKTVITSYLYCLLLEEVSFMKRSWIPKIHKISSVFQNVCYFTVAFKSHTAADRGAGHAISRTATSTIRTSFCTTYWSTVCHISRQSSKMSVSASALLYTSPIRVADGGRGGRACLLDDSHIHGCSQLCSCMTQCASVCLVLEANPLGLAGGNR